MIVFINFSFRRHAEMTTVVIMGWQRLCPLLLILLVPLGWTRQLWGRWLPPPLGCCALAFLAVFLETRTPPSPVVDGGTDRDSKSSKSQLRHTDGQLEPVAFSLGLQLLDCF